ncbi:MAG: regulator of sigma protease [Verrucomicrobiales bacterium]|nr:regulator of sigma protease [Verrucomicrobiales bacterium]
MQILKFIFILLEVLFLFNILIFVHELGHFLAAKWRGLKVERFAIWFGKPIWKAKFRGVEYVLGCIPAGGYVSLPQMATMEAIEGKTEASAEQLPPISPLDKIIVAIAGPIFSFGLAIVFAVVVCAVGRPVSQTETTTTVGYVVKDGPADKAGMKALDRIVEVDGYPVTKFAGIGSTVTWRIVRSEGETVSIKVMRRIGATTNEEPVVLTASPTHEKTKAWQRASLRKIQIAPQQDVEVEDVLTNSPAATAGLRKGDKVDKLNGEKIYSPSAIEDFVDKHSDQPVELSLDREGKQMAISIKPAKPTNLKEAKPIIGVLWSPGKIKLHNPGVGEQIEGSLNAMFSTFGALFSRKSDIKAQHLGGAVKIVSVYYFLFENDDGWRMALWFSVLLNVNLAVLNMLPFPVLDGGHITLAILEVFRRRPVSPKLLQYVQTTCAVLLIGYMVYIAFYDVQDVIPSREPRFTPIQNTK